MSTRKPIAALRVTNVETALRFYCNGLGYTLEWHRPGEAAQIGLGSALPLLLVPVGATLFKDWLHEAYQSDSPVTRRIYMQAPMAMEAYQALLRDRGIFAGEISTGTDGTKTMPLTDPDGRPIEIYQEAPLTDAEILERYEKGPAALTEALSGLTEEQLDLERAPGKWSIRQTVHHVADSEASSLVRILMALAEPGRSFRNTPYNQDVWVAGLDAAHRPVGPSVALIQAVRAHVLAIVRHLPDGLDRTLAMDMSGTVTVREILARMAMHVAGHTEQIWETRRVHGI